MTFEVWAGGVMRRIVASGAEVDTVLADISVLRGDDDAPFMVTILPIVPGADIDEISGLEVAVGHPERSVVHWTAVTGHGSGYGVEPGVPPWPEIIAFDYGNQISCYLPDQTRVTAQTGRLAARQYVTTGERPTCLQWLTG